MAIKPIGKYILITSIDEQIKHSSGLLLSSEDANQLRYKKGKVEKAGTDVSGISEGDEIYYDSRAGTEMIINSETYTIITERDVVVVL
jgi:co-chaperonin GroES (HSP10)